MARLNRKPLESTIEAYFVDKVEWELGWHCRKWKTRRADPDRICLMGNGKVLFVELKRPGEKPRPSQTREHLRLRERGYEVYVIDSKAEVDAFIELMRSTK